ncbi:MAG: diaminopimelate decarboxylase [Burkholderiaceae bacterium]|nr:diaminopimelate decarboxylase [Burkholderiaceae bacterium]
MNSIHPKTSISDDLIRDLARIHGTPLWVYDASVIRSRIQSLSAFETVRFAQKACSNTHVLRLMREQGVAVDAVSRGEILRALKAGYHAGAESSEIVFTADVIDQATLDTVVQHQVPVNAGSIDMLRQLGAASPGHRVWLRINPGFGHGHSNKTNTGGEHSKHGIWHAELEQALAVVKAQGLKLVGLHMHIGSGVDYGHLQSVCGAMVDLLRRTLAAGHDVQAISAGGGLSIPYKAGDAGIDTVAYHQLWQAVQKEAAQLFGHAIHLELEPGRYLVAESGLLITQVRAVKDAGANHFVLLDTGFNELMRPSMYGAHHHMTVLPANSGGAPGAERPTVVAGPLCESGDVFTQTDGGVVTPRMLAPAQVGDLVVIHDAGAYGASMSSNYNSRPLAAEVLVDGGDAKLIRRRQTVEELMALEEV